MPGGPFGPKGVLSDLVMVYKKTDPIYLHPHSFLGISIVSDLFMGAIEKITSKTKEIHIAGSDPNTPADVIEVPVSI